MLEIDGLLFLVKSKVKTSSSASYSTGIKQRNVICCYIYLYILIKQLLQRSRFVVTNVFIPVSVIVCR